MKTKSLLIAALIVVSATMAFAKEEPTNAGLAIVPVKGSQTFKVIYKSENTGSTTKVKIYNAGSSMIFSETVSNSGGFILPLNFAGLTAGEYTIELTDASGTKTEKVNFQPAAKSKLNVHVAKMSEEGKFLLAVANTKNNEVITVKIYDNFDNLVYNETKELNGDFAQVYSLKNTTSSYTFEVSDSTGNLKSVTF